MIWDLTGVNWQSVFIIIRLIIHYAIFGNTLIHISLYLNGVHKKGVDAMTDARKKLIRKERKENLKKYRMLYLMVIPGILYFIIFKYIPLFGNVIAFQDYNIFKGIFGSAWAGFKNFAMLFQHGDFVPILKNTIIINLYDLLFGFTAPLILALIINDITCTWFRKGVQQIVYLPHFLSWTILGGIVITQLLSPSQGMVNMLLQKLGMEPVYFMTESSMAN